MWNEFSHLGRHARMQAMADAALVIKPERHADPGPQFWNTPADGKSCPEGFTLAACSRCQVALYVLQTLGEPPLCRPCIIVGFKPEAELIEAVASGNDAYARSASIELQRRLDASHGGGTEFHDDLMGSVE